MREENIRQALSFVSGKIPEQNLIVLKNRLQAADDRKLDEILCTELYQPTHVLMFSIFLGWLGVDRFLIGDTGLGVAKLLLGWVTCGIWPLIDIFCSFRKAKEKNLQKLLLLF